MLPANATAVSLSFLLVVLVTATAWGLAPAIAASLVGATLFNFYFLPPLGTFTIADPENWTALIAFLITAVIGSELSNRAQRQAAAAVEQRREVERLYGLSRAVLLDPGEDGAGSVIARQIADSFGFDGVVFYDLRTRKAYSAGAEDLNVRAEQLDLVRELSALADGSMATPVRLGNKAIGVLVVRGEVGERALEAIANLVAITAERAASQEMASQARAARKSEELKSSILDALAHEFKTPLTSIKAASTALLARPAAQYDSERELLTIINEETDRLTKLVTEAIQASHIEAGRVRLNKVTADLSALAREVIEAMKPRLDEREITVEASAGMPEVFVDQDLMALAIRQLIDNAIKYSSPGAPITVRTCTAADRVELSVSDSGPGIPVHERAKIFEKFYRGEAIRNKVPGTGVGLSVAKEIVNAHSGMVRVESDPGRETTFTIDLPAYRESGP
jgi:two-component system sensor histidine kinase KdpD